MQDAYITEIHINKVRHLENVDIPLSKTERKHLIITGRNGSGKTSLLETMRDSISETQDPYLRAIANARASVEQQNYIALTIEIADVLIESVRIEVLKLDLCASNTAELLGYVYNGGSTDIKESECANLRNEQLLPDIQRFRQYLHGYYNEPDLGYDNLIKKEISRSSKFAAFKRKIVRDDPDLLSHFYEALA